MSGPYWTLVASLPPLPYFETAEVLPIGRERLARRLEMLDPDDGADLARVRRLVGWREHATRTSDAELGALYRTAMRETHNPALRGFVDYRMGMRTAMAGLRRRRRGLGPPTGQLATFSAVARQVCARWDAADFGLGARFPWLDAAQRDLAEGRARELETRLMRAVWARLARVADAHGPFSFERVFCYVFQWSVLTRRLRYDAEQASARFEQLIEEVTREHRDVFA